MGTETFAGKRVFVYARVSTTRQEKNDLSLPDQIATAERWIRIMAPRPPASSRRRAAPPTIIAVPFAR